MTKQFIVGGVLILVMAGILSRTRHQSLSEVSESTPAKSAVPAEQVLIPAAANSAEMAAGPGSATVSQKASIPHAEELRQYQVLKNKVFLNDEEKALRKSFLENDQLLRSLGDYLKTPMAEDPESDQAKNAATDMLLEALREVKSGAAEAALQEVVSDAAIESSQLDPMARQALAENKADILYQWSAMDPGKVSELEAMLPGPVSKKIWQNVLKAQNQNTLESADLVNERKASK